MFIENEFFSSFLDWTKGPRPYLHNNPSGDSSPAGPSSPVLGLPILMGPTKQGNLEETWRLGKQAWPQIDLPLESFVKRVAPNKDFPHPEDLYLAVACAEGIPSAQQAFVESQLSKLRQYLAKMDLSDSQFEEVRQSLQMRLLFGAESAALISQYTGRGPLGGWVRIAALRTAMNLLRSRHERHVQGTDALFEKLSTSNRDVEEIFLKGQYREEMRRAFRAAVLGLSAQDRKLLRMHFIEGHTLVQVAQALGVSRATAVRALAAARTAVLEATKEHLQTALGIRPGEEESLVRLLRSQIGASVVGALLDEP